MDEVSIEVLNVFEHFEFKSEYNQSINGLYEIKINGDKAIIFRNGDSWGCTVPLARRTSYKMY